MATRTITLNGQTLTWDTGAGVRDKADAYNSWKDAGASDAAIKTALEKAFGETIPDKDWTYLGGYAATTRAINNDNKITADEFAGL
jgi:hypothetical protein